MHCLYGVLHDGVLSQWGQHRCVIGVSSLFTVTKIKFVLAFDEVLGCAGIKFVCLHTEGSGTRGIKLDGNLNQHPLKMVYFVLRLTPSYQIPML